jgi:hypothetical protein
VNSQIIYTQIKGYCFYTNYKNKITTGISYHACNRYPEDLMQNYILLLKEDILISYLRFKKGELS